MDELGMSIRKFKYFWVTWCLMLALPFYIVATTSVDEFAFLCCFIMFIPGIAAFFYYNLRWNTFNRDPVNPNEPLTPYTSRHIPTDPPATHATQAIPPDGSQFPRDPGSLQNAGGIPETATRNPYLLAPEHVYQLARESQYQQYQQPQQGQRMEWHEPYVFRDWYKKDFRKFSTEICFYALIVLNVINFLIYLEVHQYHKPTFASTQVLLILLTILNIHYVLKLHDSSETRELFHPRELPHSHFTVLLDTIP